MRNWDLPFDDPQLLTLAADARFCKIDVFDDQIWELSLGRREPPSLMMYTTYGLRAQSMSVFPRFLFNDQVYIDPMAFLKKPALQYFLPNYISLNLSVSAELACTAEYWAPDSHTVAGSYQFVNTGNKVLTLRFELCSNLKPLDEGENMRTAVMGDSAVLMGKTVNLAPVCLLAGVSQTADSPFPTLWQDFQIVPGKSRSVYWALASETDAQASLEHAREILSPNWEARIARVMMENDSQNLDIYTGDPGWDWALAAAQRSAFSLVMNPESETTPFVKSRRVDMGYSFAEEGKGVIPQWKNPSALDAWVLSGFLLPGGADLVQSILDHFLSKYRPALSISRDTTRRSFREVLDQPVLCTLAEELYEISGDRAWLADSIEALTTYFRLWFTPDQDKDLDGFPEWQNIEQSGLEDSPLFERWKEDTQGLNIRMVESPALPAFLFRECTSLIKLIRAAGREDLLPEFEGLPEKLAGHVNDTWNERSSAFFFRDYATHQTQNGKELFKGQGNGVFQVNASFSKPQRLLVQISGKDDTRRRFKILLSGQKSGETVQETVDFFTVSWLHGRAYYTCSNLFTRLDTVEISAISPADEICILGVYHQMTDISTLLPIWAGCLDAQHAGKLIEKNIHKRYWTPYGLPVCAKTSTGRFKACDKVSMPWNQLIGEGLIAYGRQKLAVELVDSLMKTVNTSLARYHEFMEEFHAHGAEPSGEAGNLRGFTPRRLFLACLGVQYVQSNHLRLSGQNLFPWPVTVKYKGVSLTRHAEETTITFTTGQTITVTGDEAKEIQLANARILEKKDSNDEPTPTK